MTFPHSPELQFVPKMYYQTEVSDNCSAGVYAHLTMPEDCAWLKDGEMLPDSSRLHPYLATSPSMPWDLHSTPHGDYQEPPVHTPSTSRSPSPGGSAQAQAQGLYEYWQYPESSNVGFEGTVYLDSGLVYNKPVENEAQGWNPCQYASPLDTDAPGLAGFSVPHQFGLAYVSCQFGTECGTAIQDVTPKGVCEHLQHYHSQDIDSDYAHDVLKCLWQTNGESCGAARYYDAGLCEHITKWSWSRMPCVAPEHTISCEQLCESPAAIM
ncbi:uncharacterized protein B0H18DRAFT_1024176 [Fomitopsis serialis]|uniref:uncharacterized protein n=1 Tax=Fomitopsis serialis TaxID=139415 RepID=UPI002007EC31|nr:uncharacterized protein B0H18DRAFT_1024176 [Neoantrodia serialis]KAH9920476.1 hypothetical protein B0H18DRAFT_1024176 [Neoantrodia serialis]